MYVLESMLNGLKAIATSTQAGKSRDDGDKQLMMMMDSCWAVVSSPAKKQTKTLTSSSMMPRSAS